MLYKRIVMTRKEVAEWILDYFRRSKCRAGHVVMLNHIMLDSSTQLSPVDRDQVIPVAEELIDNGYFAFEDSKPQCFRLSEKGYKYIYNSKAVLDCCFESGIANEPVVVETSHWLNSYPGAKAVYTRALTLYEQKDFSREILDNMRLSLEYFFRQLVGNTKSLENNIVEIGKLLKVKGYNPEFSNMLIKLIEYYTKYQNNYVKHNDKVNPLELDFIILQTTAFMRAMM